MNDLPRGRAGWYESISLILRVVILVSLILALAGPRSPDRTTRLPTRGIAIAFVCDRSGSMGEIDFRDQVNSRNESRFDAARGAFELFVKGGQTATGITFAGRANDSIALITFAAWPITDCPLTLNHTVLIGLLNKLEPHGAGLDAGTNIGDAIAEALIRLKAVSDRKRVIILLSDGEHNATGQGDQEPLAPRQAAQLAANLGIPIYTIDCGGEPALDASPESRAQRQQGKAILQAVAEMTGGQSFSAQNESELLSIYHNIDQLERSPILSFQYRRYHLYAGGFAVAAMMGFALIVSMEQLFWRRLS